MFLTNFRFLWRFLQPYRWQFLGALLLRIISDASYLVYPYLIGLLTTEVARGTALRMDIAQQYLGAIIAVNVFLHVSRHIAKGVIVNLSDKLELAGRVDGMEEMMGQRLSWHERFHTEEKMGAVRRSSLALREILYMLESTFVQTAVIILGGIGVVATLDWRFALVFAGYTVVSILVLRWDRKKIRSEVKEMIEGYDRLNALQHELVHHVHTAYALGMYDTTKEHLRKEEKGILTHALSRNFLARKQWMTQAAIWLVFFIAMLWVVVERTALGAMEVGMLTTLILYFSMVDNMTNAFVNGLQTLNISRVSIEKYHKIFDKQDQKKQDGIIPLSKDWKQLKIEDLHASYGEHQVLHGVTMTIQRGEKLGVVGLSGSGKSTLLGLLSGLRPYTSGDITFDDLSLQDIQESSWRPYLGIALQDTEVLHLSFRENLSLAAPRATEEDIQSLIQSPWLAPILQKLPQGLDTLIGEKGVRLSGGERQRLGIARALLRRPQLLLFDEATSHLDSHTEAQVQQAIDALQGVTVVAVAHRLSTLRNFDRIIVMEHGKIIEEGTWEELLQLDGAFAQLKKRQDKEQEQKAIAPEDPEHFSERSAPDHL